MSSDKIRDLLALPYHKLPVYFSSHCNINGEFLSLKKSLNCPSGGLVHFIVNCAIWTVPCLNWQVQQINSELIIQEIATKTKPDWSVGGF